MDEKESEKRPDPVLRVLKSLARGVLVLALFFYLLYHLTSGFSTEMKTQVVKPVTEAISVFGKGTVVRDEKVITSGTSGVVSYIYEDGEKVKINSRVAKVYSNASDEDALCRIAEIDRAIELLTLAEIDTDTRVSDGTAAKREISSLLMNVSQGIGKGEYGKVAYASDRILTEAVRRDTILSGGGGAGETLAALRDERSRLAATLGGTETVVKAPWAGYFYSHTDGGEVTFDFSGVSGLSPAEYRVKADMAGTAVANAVGKIVRSPKWYLLLPVEETEARVFGAGKSYDVAFEGDGITVKMLLESKNEGDGESLLVFSSKLMPSGFSFDRRQNVSVVSDTVSGYKIPLSALRVVDGYVGVYVRSGNNIKFRAAEQLYESGAYVFLATDTEGITLYAADEDETNDIYCKGLSLYDAVIVGGAKDLSPDRIVN
ncbi:MAG: hypothetical protein IKU61_04885 [Clostridia bacterium]|nr:hypothetical protein [Clostridia bacterium]